MAEKQELCLIIDSREQKPFDFSRVNSREFVITTETKKLDAGDYSIKGLENRFIVERKAVADLVGTLVAGHERFIREMGRMNGFDEAYIVVEGQATDIFRQCWEHGQDRFFNMMMQSLLAYAYHYHIRVKLCKDREDATIYTAKKAIEFYKKINSTPDSV